LFRHCAAASRGWFEQLIGQLKGKRCCKN
jgi:hypothetical protein